MVLLVDIMSPNASANVRRLLSKVEHQVQRHSKKMLRRSQNVASHGADLPEFQKWKRAATPMNG